MLAIRYGNTHTRGRKPFQVHASFKRFDPISIFVVLKIRNTCCIVTSTSRSGKVFFLKKELTAKSGSLLC